MENKPKKKKRATTYQKPLKIYASFDQAIKALVTEPKHREAKKK